VVYCNINGYLGDQYTDATLTGNRWDINIGANISF
jgi:hypothetical protein